MNTDKAVLRYGGKRQFERAFDLLSAHCVRVFLSLRPSQAKARRYAHFPKIPDLLGDLGPLGGILSALETYPEAAWLVMACDLPFLDLRTLRHLIRSRNRKQIATAYRSVHDGLPEPLCAIYEPRSAAALRKFVKRGITCPRRALLRARIDLLEPVNPRALDNVNTRAEYVRARAEIERA